MLRKSSSIKVFSRFNRTVVLVFTLVIVVALSLAATRYFREFDAFKKQAEHTMNQRAQILNDKLDHSVKALTGLIEFANYCLKHPSNTIRLLPNLAQDGENYYLKHPQRDVINQRTQLSGNITGIGDINHFDPLLKQELAMANLLTPAFITARHTNPEVTWFYYLSKKRFVNLYPWVSRKVWRYRDRLIEREYFAGIQKLQKTHEFYWSPPYKDSAGKGLTASLAGGVIQANKFVGALILDINLNKLSKSLPQVQVPQQGYVLLDKNYHVLFYNSLNNKEITGETKWREVIPEQLSQLSNKQLSALGRSQKVADWFVQKQILPVNGWTLIKYQPYKEFIAPLSGEFLFWFIVLFSGLVAFIVLIYWLTNRTFINPATEFIQHIENCAQGDSGKIKPTEDWRHWFHVVEDIFSQNRSLMQQLKDKNADLDKLVKEKTQDLVETSEKHQRDYALLRSVMNAMQELIIFSDSEGKLIGCNLALEKFVQQKEQNILGLKACELLPQPMCASLHELSQQACNDSQQKAYQRVLKTSTQTFELFSRQFFNESDTLLGTINIFRDVSEAYAIQNALEKAKNQAEHANQAKGQFLANMSHEIRTPLNAIQGMMYLLAKTSLNKAQDQYLSNAETASKSLLNLIDELLDLAKIEAGKLPLFKTDVVLDQVIDKALKLNVGKALEKNLPVNICIAEDVPQIIYSDEVRLLQVLTNLLNNAIKFTHQGEVMLTVEMLSIADEAHIQFSVVDSGIGIAQEKQASLFNAFTQADESMTRKYGGSGLGLSICLQIVKLLGGEIKLTSEHTQGSTFSFSLPLANVIADKDATISFQLISVDTHLSSSLVATMAKHNCTYMPLANLSELESVIFSTHGNDVLLLNVEQVEKLAQQAINISDKFKLIVLTIPMLSEISDNISLILEKSDINWIIAEAPIYRVILTQIEQALNFEEGDKHAIEGGESEQLNQPNLLLVEDNLVNQMVAQELLQSMNANVIIANNGQEALDLLAENNIDLVLMDIQMPVMDGLTATREIRKIAEFEVLPIIAMTAHAREEDRQHSLDAGMNLHIAKPVTYEKLLSSIKSLLVEK